MTSRQRVLDTINHNIPDRVPIDFWAVPEVYAQLREDLGVDDDESVRKHFGVDLRYFNGPTLRTSRPTGKDGISEDHWGVRRKYATVDGVRRDGTEYTWTYKHLHESPLGKAKSVADIERYEWPTVDLWDYSRIKAACQTIRDSGYAVVAGADRLDRTAQLKPAMYLRGAEQFMEDLALHPEIAECILEHISSYYLEYNRRVFEAANGSIDIFFMGDDMGTQNSTWVSSQMYRKFFRGRLAAYCDLAHQFGISVMYHTCGNISTLVEDFIDAGVDILQSLQPGAMDSELARLKREYGKHLCFQGGIDIQHILPNGTPAEVTAHVRDRVNVLSDGGGYIFGTAHNILPDIPTENILALVEAYHRYGQY